MFLKQLQRIALYSKSSNRSKNNLRLQTISEGKLTDKEVFQANCLNKGVNLFFE